MRLVFIVDPGDAVVLGMSDLGDRFRLVGNEVTVVTPQDMPRLPVGRAGTAPTTDVREGCGTASRPCGEQRQGRPRLRFA